MGLEWQKIIQSLNFTIIANWINFGILVAVLSWLLYKPAKEFIETRREKIKSRIEGAKEREKSAAELKQERLNELKAAREKRREILDRAEKEAEEIVERGRKKAKEESKRIIEEAKAEAKQEQDKLRKELEEEYIDLSLLGAEKILGREIDERDQRRFLDSLLEEIEGDEIDLQ
ncbi:F0F1 ATP synthase subunit B [Candidatus Bipolaricaulota bacterium]|nr:F0F1 ATP synthase subunit B [Candidatus Bipolaricaulota bacterium]